jgi:DNA-binding IscR family transcriptional regulator
VIRIANRYYLRSKLPGEFSIRELAEMLECSHQYAKKIAALMVADGAASVRPGPAGKKYYRLKADQRT